MVIGLFLLIIHCVIATVALCSFAYDFAKNEERMPASMLVTALFFPIALVSAVLLHVVAGIDRRCWELLRELEQPPSIKKLIAKASR